MEIVKKHDFTDALLCEMHRGELSANSQISRSARVCFLQKSAEKDKKCRKVPRWNFSEAISGFAVRRDEEVVMLIVEFHRGTIFRSRGVEGEAGFIVPEKTTRYSDLIRGFFALALTPEFTPALTP